MDRKEKLDKLKVLLFWLGAFMASIGFWMLFAMLTGYPYPIPWWTNVLQKINWITWALLYGAITGYLLTYLIKRKAGLK
jgi:hypothetical protein